MSFVLQVLALCASNQPVPIAEELESRLLKHRDSIRFGKLQIKSECYEFRTTEKRLLEQVERTVWFDGARIRLSWVGKTSLTAQHVKHLCVPFRTAKDSLWYDESIPKPDGGRIIIKSQDKNDPYNHYRIDPKSIGLYAMPISNYAHYRLEAPLSRADRRGSVKPVTWQGKTGYQVVYEFLDDRVKQRETKLRMLVIPELDYSPIEVELTRVDKGEPFQLLTRIQYKKFGKSQRWYPHKLDHTRTLGGRLIEEDKSEVIMADFDTPPPASVFEIAAMGSPAGTPVIINFDGKERVWNGKDIVEKPKDQKKIAQHFLPFGDGQRDGPSVACRRHPG